jgi:hypothetical protein
MSSAPAEIGLDHDSNLTGLVEKAMEKLSVHSLWKNAGA